MTTSDCAISSLGDETSLAPRSSRSARFERLRCTTKESAWPFFSRFLAMPWPISPSPIKPSFFIRRFFSFRDLLPHGDDQRLREADRPGEHAERLRAFLFDLEAHAGVRRERRERMVGDGDHRYLACVAGLRDFDHFRRVIAEGHDDERVLWPDQLGALA